MPFILKEADANSGITEDFIAQWNQVALEQQLLPSDSSPFSNSNPSSNFSVLNINSALFFLFNTH